MGSLPSIISIFLPYFATRCSLFLLPLGLRTRRRSPEVQKPKSEGTVPIGELLPWARGANRSRSDVKRCWSTAKIPASQPRFFPGFVFFLAAKCWLVIELVPLNPGTFSSQGHLHAGAEGFYPCSPALPPLSQVCAAAAAPCGPATRGWWTTSSPRTQR